MDINNDNDLKFWLGPMEGIFSPSFITAVNRLQLVDRWMTPFLRISAGVPNHKILAKFLEPYLQSEVPVTVQIMGVSPKLLACTAKNLINFGIAGVNLNFGCPSKRVVSSGAGGGALKDLNLMLNIIKFVKNAIGDLNLSVKMRSAYENHTDMDMLLPAIAETKCVNKIFWHYRTVKEGYANTYKIHKNECKVESNDGDNKITQNNFNDTSSEARDNFIDVPINREERFVHAKKLVGNIPLIINGDCNDTDSTLKLIQRVGAQGAMTARGWLRDPWLLWRCRGKDAPNQIEGTRVFFETLQNCGVCGGNRLELLKMIFGVDSQIFRANCAAKKTN